MKIFKEHDNKVYSLKDAWDGEETLNFSYKPIKLWETEKEIIIQKKLLGLYPLIPLMKRDLNESNEDIIKTTVDVIKLIEEEALKSDLLAITSILGGYVFTPEFIKRFIRRDMLMNSPLFNEWVEEERKEAAKEATKEATKKIISELLVEKFDFVPKDIRNTINSIDDIVFLDELLRKIIKVNSIEEFKKLLDKVKVLC